VLPYVMFPSSGECSAHSHSRLVHQGDNPNKETLIYVPYVMSNHGHKRPAKKGSEVEMSPKDRLDASTPSWGPK